MLKYLVDATRQLASMMVLCGLILSFVRVAYSSRRMVIPQVGMLLGFIFAIALTVVKKTTNKINMGTWNLWIYSVSLGAFVLFLIFALLGKKWKNFGEIAASAALGLEICMLLFNYLPSFLVMPHTILLAEETMISTSFLLKLIGVLFGLILTFLAGFAAYKCCSSLSKGANFAFLLIGLLVEMFRDVATAFGIMLSKRMISSNHTLFMISKYASNWSDGFLYFSLLLGVAAAVIILLKGIHVNEPYTNPAEHRKIRAKWRFRRRWSTTVLVCVVLSVLTLTVVDAYANREVELSPIEDALIQDGAVYVSFEQVNDGHLHRFGYTTDSGTVIRFIVIKKPNSSAYGIGLDACDICGETGYYEKDGQVVCNLCDVVMNINTIGFKGGCNPIIIDYQIENGYIIVPIDGLLEYESEFK